MKFELFLLFFSSFGFSVYDDLFAYPKMQVRRTTAPPKQHQSMVEIENIKCYLPVRTKQTHHETPVNKLKIIKIIKKLPCLKLQTNDWFYEFCNNKYTQRFNLANIKEELDLTEVEVTYLEKVEYKLGTLKSQSTVLEKFMGFVYLEKYIDGSFCEEIQEPRELRIYYSCGFTLQILEIVEYSVCKFSAYVNVPDLCALESEGRLSEGSSETGLSTEKLRGVPALENIPVLATLDGGEMLGGSKETSDLAHLVQSKLDYYLDLETDSVDLYIDCVDEEKGEAFQFDYNL
jgi:hypothetical protein